MEKYLCQHCGGDSYSATRQEDPPPCDKCGGPVEIVPRDQWSEETLKRTMASNRTNGHVAG